MRFRWFFLGTWIFFLNLGVAQAFEDVYLDNPYYDAIVYYEALGLVEGYEDGTFRDEDKVNRVEVLKMILENAGVEVASVQAVTLPFTDTTQNEWYTPYLQYAYDLDYVKGYVDGTFRPADEVTLAETLSILYQVQGYPVNPSTELKWYEFYVKDAQAREFLGFLKSQDPHYAMTRGELLVLLYQLDTGLGPVSHVEVKQPYTLDALDEIDTSMQEADPSLSEEFDRLKAHVEEILYHDYELPVPIHYQQRTLSCEVASLKAVLNFYGVVVNEATLFDELKKADPYYYESEENRWGNPHDGFVGSVDGSQLGMTGYGVYWDPIADLAFAYREHVYSFEGEDLAFLLEHIVQGQPVIVWGYTYARGGLVDLSWNTPEGELIYAVNGEHTYTVIGFEGAIEDPKAIILIDPLVGRVRMTTSNFLNNWGTFNNSGVVVE